jgi:hypothetical protein
MFIFYLLEFIPIMVYWASHERRHHVWPVEFIPIKPSVAKV